jgi:hypothetical protein
MVFEKSGDPSTAVSPPPSAWLPFLRGFTERLYSTLRFRAPIKMD